VTNPLDAEHQMALLRDWARGSRASGEALIRSMLPGIYGLCLRILRNESDAQDAAQDAFAKLTVAVQQGTEIRELRKWMATVAMNKSIDIQRGRGRTVPLEESGPLEPAAEDSEPLDRLDLPTLRGWIDQLPDRYRLILHYHFQMGMPPRDIAETMGLEPGTARVLLHRAVAALRKKAKP
jgi:RNA polymerase sigma-70 factor (ECF subfamily)